MLERERTCITNGWGLSLHMSWRYTCMTVCGVKLGHMTGPTDPNNKNIETVLCTSDRCQCYSSLGCQSSHCATENSVSSAQYSHDCH